MSRRIIAIATTMLLAACGASPGGPPRSPTSQPAAGKGLQLQIKRLPPAGPQAKPGVVLQALQTENKRSMERFAKLKAPRPYFLSYQVTDQRQLTITASHGALASTLDDHRRVLDVELRVGDYKLDNTNPVGRGGFGFGSWVLPLDDDAAAIRPTVWQATEKRYRQAKEAYARVKAAQAVKAKAEDTSDDFSREQPVTHLEQPVQLKVDLAAWNKRLRAYSALLKQEPSLLRSKVILRVMAINRYLTNSEGSAVQTGRVYARLMVLASTRTEDGMDLHRYESIDASSVQGLVNEAEIKRRIQLVLTDLRALRKAPLTDPFVGPAILEGRAAGVYFHEIFGHRMEGHRQKQRREGQTFAKKIGKLVLPRFIDVYDDPTLRAVNGIELNGYYRVDDEGVRASKASLVDRGVLKGFIMGRSPVRGFNRSNGHGRRQAGRAPVARQGNLIVHPARVTTPADLKAQLLAEIKRQKKPFGLRFTLVEGGFTNTSRYMAQFFKVKPVMVYKVYPDGREELVRGADIEGTPLTSLSQIVAAADDVTVFNGYCGAESGMVPVSAASPSLLVKRVEIARKMSRKDKPPILPAPPSGAEGGAK